VDGPQPYPVRIEGQLDTGLSRWLWLVKWILAIPHYIVLAFLWLTLLVLTIVAFFAILFTGRTLIAIARGGSDLTS
jgi:FtsH-binding integral membrane protein